MIILFMKIAALKIERAKAEKNNIVCVKACGQSTIIATTALLFCFWKKYITALWQPAVRNQASPDGLQRKWNKIFTRSQSYKRSKIVSYCNSPEWVINNK